mmetsp:Transcript_52758/g.146235  ORF Transcript_52758/g.146235 Transcript_52758/m.146235 type:complete len:280 (-) Transcript_52758:1109-1948(-)
MAAHEAPRQGAPAVDPGAHGGQARARRGGQAAQQGGPQVARGGVAAASAALLAPDGALLPGHVRREELREPEGGRELAGVLGRHGPAPGAAAVHPLGGLRALPARLPGAKRAAGRRGPPLPAEGPPQQDARGGLWRPARGDGGLHPRAHCPADAAQRPGLEPPALHVEGSAGDPEARIHDIALGDTPAHPHTPQHRQDCLRQRRGLPRRPALGLRLDGRGQASARPCQWALHPRDRARPRPGQRRDGHLHPGLEHGRPERDRLRVVPRDVQVVPRDGAQ